MNKKALAAQYETDIACAKKSHLENCMRLEREWQAKKEEVRHGLAVRAEGTWTCVTHDALYVHVNFGRHALSWWPYKWQMTCCALSDIALHG